MDKDNVSINKLTTALISILQKPEEGSKSSAIVDKINISQSVSFFGVLYERLRNAIEFNEEHLVRRAAIERILKRRFRLNPQGTGEAENVVRELLWGRYIDGDDVTDEEMANIQKIISSYIFLLSQVIKTIPKTQRSYYGELILNFLSCEIEEAISPKEALDRQSELFYFYQTLKNSVSIDQVAEDTKDLYFFAASETALLRNDTSFVRYHIFCLTYGKISQLPEAQVRKVAQQFPTIITNIQKTIKNPYAERLIRFSKKNVPPYRILFDLVESQKENILEIIAHKSQLEEHIREVCKAKYLETAEKLKRAAFRSITYIFCTKMIFVLVIELPVSSYLYGEVSLLPLLINTLFPPLLMGVIVSFISAPTDKNTGRIFDKTVQIITSEPTTQPQNVYLIKKRKERRPTLLFMFTVMYIAMFYLTFTAIYFALDILEFHFISKAIFMFFISVVAFFGYRIRQTAKEYVLESEPNFIISAITFFFLPILYVGKILSNQISKINILIVFFDSLIEAPFKFLIEVIEEWSKFVKARKEEIV